MTPPDASRSDPSASSRPCSERGGDTRERLLGAAATVFARDGFEGATTRAIAREAGVNEVTLFRHFQTKENLQSAVLQRIIDQQAELLSSQPPLPGADLRASLARYAALYEAVLRQNLPLVKTLLGEHHKHRDYEPRVLRGIFAPLKAELAAAVEKGRRDGSVRQEINPAIAADLLSAMIFTAVLRRGSPFPPREYGHAAYVAAAIEMVARGVGAGVSDPP